MVATHYESPAKSLPFCHICPTHGEPPNCDAPNLRQLTSPTMSSGRIDIRRRDLGGCPCRNPRRRVAWVVSEHEPSLLCSGRFQMGY
ncbi:hypothetical protein TIFTF001_032811 [Ficus carica]|uniref:Uncharacterized protein n=1 Tax=Ficus carica TaxID=3494 RepID=A0AA88DXC2_FICCA|nr:hypothetical protein TIFTF001_032811 [Ficus carica]